MLTAMGLIPISLDCGTRDSDAGLLYKPWPDTSSTALGLAHPPPTLTWGGFEPKPTDIHFKLVGLIYTREGGGS